MAATGERMAGFLEGLLRAPGPVHRAWRQIPFLIPIVWGCTTVEPTARIVARLQQIERESGALLSFTAGFPAADFPDCGPAVYAFGPDRGAVERAVTQLADEVEAREPDWGGRLLDAAAAVRAGLRQSGQEA